MASAVYPVYPQAVVLPILSILSILLSIVPLALHWKNRNYPASSLICWYLILNVFNTINALIWPTDDIASWWDGNGLCDLETKIMIGSYIAIPGTLVCIFRNLAIVLDTRRAALVPTRSQRWWNRGMVLLFCVVAPVIAMITNYVYQGKRYLLFAIAGCMNAYDESWVTLVLAEIWPIIICIIAGYYCILVLHRLGKYRSQFGEILQASSSNLTKSRFMRLFLLAFLMQLAIIPVQTYVFSTNIAHTLPWHPFSWTAVHGPDWNHIFKVPMKGQVFYDRWIPVSSGYMFFIFFGSGRDASKMYRAVLRFLGFGRCFNPLNSTRANDSSATGSRSTGSRAKLLFHKRWTSTARTHMGNSVDSTPSARNYHDIEKGPTSRPKQSQWTSWYRRPWHLLNPPPSLSHERIVLQNMPEHSNTVSTNAWAATTVSRGSSDLGNATPADDHIRVKQVISQESELHL
ncbi:a-pheromone receptor PreA [Aspergillus heteromorphus CBS 117.55]|uniref:A-pheromone receptor PreA n=1 Tax=Aspergillus heteromorphus CBS 117.55 TaxID=1448321 RepID=A0A317VI80_9EURO|nr:a-pheromone receptor PreA [Aspergillus heteromorphus CBS 117.55]PWY72901.1 a-pheromone receptor PreA [Aspergillus heteromorphus CBS 117.55]